MYKKCKVVVLRNKPIAFLTSWLPSPSSLLKLPKIVYFFLLGDHHTLEVLAFPESPSREISSSELKVPCIFCDREFPNTAGKNDAVLHHLLIEHQLVISDVAQVCDMRRCLVFLNLVQ